MTKLTLEDLATPKAIEVATKKVLLDYINESEEIAKLDREKIAALGEVQSQLLVHCRRDHTNES